MYPAPDSALHILQGMTPPADELNRATWALLLSQAKYKCFVDQSDSLVNVAYEYFMKGEDAQRKALTLYHKGVLHEEKKQDDKALHYHLQASEDVILTEDYRLAYLIYSHIGMIYAYWELHEYSVSYCKKANEYAILSGDPYYIVESYNCIARTYSAQKQYDKTVEYYDKAIEIGRVHNKKKLVNSAIQEKIGILIRQKKLEEAQNLVKTLNHQMLNNQANLTIGHLYYRLNQTDSAYYYLNRAIKSDNIYTQQSAYQV